MDVINRTNSPNIIVCHAKLAFFFVTFFGATLILSNIVISKNGMFVDLKKKITWLLNFSVASPAQIETHAVQQ